MKQSLLICLLLAFAVLCLADDLAVPNHYKPLRLPTPGHITAPADRDTTDYIFSHAPTTIMQSYWDYMIGGYSNLPIRTQTPETGGGMFLTYMGKRVVGASGVRRVFSTYIDSNGEVQYNNELSGFPTRKEGFSSIGMDKVTGVPFFTFHADVNTDTPVKLEDVLIWDKFLDMSAGSLSQEFLPIDNPTTIGNTTDNEFIWPCVEIGPSPTPGARRIYVFTTNSVSHTVTGTSGVLPSENILLAYTDITTEQMMADETTLTWNYNTIPLLDQWNVDLSAFHRFQGTKLVGNDGKLFIVGSHIANEADGTTNIDEPAMDVWVNSNYGVGEWAYYNFDVDQPEENPYDYFVDTDNNNTPFTGLFIGVMSSSHINAYLDNQGLLHTAQFFALQEPGGSYWPSTMYLKDVIFDPTAHTMVVHDMFPTGVHPNDGNYIKPWDMDEDGITDTLHLEDGTVIPDIAGVWPFNYWDSTIVDNAMIFHYNYVHVSQMNNQGMVAAVWTSSQRAKYYHDYPDSYPELAAFANVPEIYVSVYPVNGQDGPQWSDPVSINSVETPEMHIGTTPIVPEWVYPADQVKYLGVNPQGSKLGQFYMMFLHDPTWSSYSNSNVGTEGLCNVMYMALQAAWGPGPSDVSNNHPVATPNVLLEQNYPNPFNPTTQIAFTLKHSGPVTLEVYNVKGQKVKTLVNGVMPSGRQTVQWNGQDDQNRGVASGMYFYRVSSSQETQTRKMILIK